MATISKSGDLGASIFLSLSLSYCDSMALHCASFPCNAHAYTKEKTSISPDCYDRDNDDDNCITLNEFVCSNDIINYLLAL